MSCLIESPKRLCNLDLCAAAVAKSLQLCLTPCDPIDGSPSGSPFPGILQARVLEWGAIAFSVDLCTELQMLDCQRYMTSWDKSNEVVGRNNNKDTTCYVPDTVLST